MSKQEESKNKLSTLFKLFLLITIVWLISIFLLTCIYKDLQNRGMFGDSFGVINSLFSGLAFAGIIYTIILQREELELTRKELTKSADAQIESQKELAKQSLNLKRTAELNAMSMLLAHLQRKEAHFRSDTNLPDWQKTMNEIYSERERYLKRIRRILEDKRQ